MIGTSLAIIRPSGIGSMALLRSSRIGENETREQHGDGNEHCHEATGKHQPRHDAGNEHATDGDFCQNPVNNEEQARRDQHTEYR